MAGKTELEAEGRPASAAGGEAGAKPTPTGGSAGGAPEQTVAGGSELTPEIQQIVEQRIAEAAAKHERDIAKLKSAYDKKLSEAAKAERARREAEIQQALQIRETDPETAVNILAGHVAQMTAAEQAQHADAQIAEWRERVLAEMGLDAGDEEVQALVQRLGPATSQEYGYSLLGEAGKLASQRAKAAEKKADDLMAELPKLVEEQVKKALAAGGLAPDLSGPSGGGGKDEWRNLSATELLRRSTAEAKRTMKK